MRKHILALLLIAVAGPTLANADDHRGPDFPPPGPPGAFQPMPGHDFAGGPGLQGIELNQEQRKVVRDAGRDERLAAAKITQDYLDKLSDADKASMKMAMAHARSEAQAKIMKVMTPAQAKQFEANLARDDRRRAEWDEFQKWKADKRG